MIEIIKLSKRYRKKSVLENISTNILDNRITFLMGENGSGKTTLIKSILELEKHEGSVLFDGKPMNQVYGEISVVYDDSPFYLHLNGYKNIQLLSNRNLTTDEINDFALQFLNEDNLRKKVSQYSYGQRKKLSLIIAFLNKPKYIFMDEVSNGLDYETMEKLKKILKNYSKKSLIFLTGHQFDFYNDIVDDVFIIKNKSVSVYNLDNLKDKKSKLGWLYEKNVKDF